MPTEKNITKIDSKNKLLYVTLAIPLIGATIALSFGDPACLQNIGGDDTTTVTSTDVDTTSTTVTSGTTTSVSSATSDVTSTTSAVTSTTSAVTSDTDSTLDSTTG